MNREYEMVKEFHKTFGHPVADRPTMLEDRRGYVRTDWMVEEIQEFLLAQSITDQVDAMIDLIYFALGTLVEIGVPPETAFEIVHKANMTKFDEEGKVRRRGDGKILKPAWWMPPDKELEQYIESLLTKFAHTVNLKGKGTLKSNVNL